MHKPKFKVMAGFYRHTKIASHKKAFFFFLLLWIFSTKLTFPCPGWKSNSGWIVFYTVWSIQCVWCFCQPVWLSLKYKVYLYSYCLMEFLYLQYILLNCTHSRPDADVITYKIIWVKHAHSNQPRYVNR